MPSSSLVWIDTKRHWRVAAGEDVQIPARANVWTLQANVARTQESCAGAEGVELGSKEVPSPSSIGPIGESLKPNRMMFPPHPSLNYR